MKAPDTKWDSVDAFKLAIAQRRLSGDTWAGNYAGRYMYMGADSTGLDTFKNIDTRRYLSARIT